jgi:ParB family chromosome partitioning protein
VLQPITVRLINGSRYELVAGERRLRAATLLGRETIPAIIVSLTDRDSALLALIENLQRKDLNFLEEAEGLCNLAKDYRLTQEEIARRIGKSQSTVANKLRLLRLPREVKTLLIDNGLTERHARAVLKLEAAGGGAEAAMIDTARAIAARGLNVKEAEALVDSRLARLAGGSPPASGVKIKTYVKDLRIFTNTIKRAVGITRGSGPDASFDIEERSNGRFISISVNRAD